MYEGSSNNLTIASRLHQSIIGFTLSRLSLFISDSELVVFVRNQYLLVDERKQITYIHWNVILICTRFQALAYLSQDNREFPNDRYLLRHLGLVLNYAFSIFHFGFL